LVQTLDANVMAVSYSLKVCVQGLHQ